MSDFQPNQESQFNQYGTPPTTPVVRGPMRTKPVLVWVILVLTVLFFIVQTIFEQTTGIDFPFLYLGKINQAILAGQIWRLITPVFLHGNILHLFSNMYALYVLGRNNEMLNGHLRFGLLYFLSAFGGNVLSFVLGNYTSLGASTAVFGLLAAEAVFIWQNRTFFGNQAGRSLRSIVMVLMLNLMIGLRPGGVIDNWGHLGGLIAGFFFSYLAGVRWQIDRIDGGYPAFIDRREKKEIIMAVVLVFVAFAAIAVIPFLR